MGQNWTNLFADGRRLNRIIRLLETKLKKAQDDDKIIKYANSIAYLTSKKIEIVDRCLGVQYLLNKFKGDEKIKVYETKLD